MANVAVEDLSGSSTPVTSNPYDGLILATDNNPKQLQERYQLHRVTRNSQQKSKILADDFPGWILDEHLVRLDGPQKDETYQDPRNCLVFWARPPQKVKNLISIIQQKLKDVAPDLWLMPIENLHMTALEVAHSKTAAEIDHLVSMLEPVCESIADRHQGPTKQKQSARLIKPLLSYDCAALALSFVPAAGELLSAGTGTGLGTDTDTGAATRSAKDDQYTYHHLRRDVYNQVASAGIRIGSRYVVPSAHLTIARFNTPNPFGGGGGPLDQSVSLDIHKRRHWVNELETINKWLEAEFWPGDSDSDNDNDNKKSKIRAGGEWVVGEEKGLDFRKGRLWYGGGETVYLGKGI